jgi:hypothetical protein
MLTLNLTSHLLFDELRYNPTLVLTLSGPLLVLLLCHCAGATHVVI